MAKRIKKSGTDVEKPPTSQAGGSKGGPEGVSGGGSGGGSGGPTRGRGFKADRYPPPKSAAGKHLVIVESPTKAKTINKYLGSDYAVMASVGHVRDLPKRAPKGVKQDVPGVDLAHNFEPTYEVMPEKKKTVSQLQKAAKEATDVWFATDLDREGEAIAWHLAQALGVPVQTAKRVVFNAITKDQIQHAFAHPRSIDEAMVNAQQARRILDRIVGYQVSPLLWKKVAGGLSAGRVQSVAARLVVDREREIESFIPEEFWKISGYFATDLKAADALAKQWRAFVDNGLAKITNGAPPPSDWEGRTIRERLIWLNERKCLRAELVEYAGQEFAAKDRDTALAAAKKLGMALDEAQEWQDPKGRGPARFLCIYHGSIKNPPAFAIQSIQTKRVTSRPPAPFITSTLQQAGSTRLGFPLQRTMRIAQDLYQGVDIHGIEGQTGLITYMRTDSTNLSGEALNMARGYIQKSFGAKYLPEKPNFFTSSNKDAQEAHEAIRPTDVNITPERVRKDLKEEQYKLYKIIWERFVACQMTGAEWDSTTVLIDARESKTASPLAVFKTTGRTLVFDGYLKVSGMPTGEEAILPPLTQGQPLAPLQVDPTQAFTSPPPRYTEASLQKKLESEGIGRPSTYASIISTIQDRKYVQPLSQRDRRLYATDLGKVVTDKLVEAFPSIMEVDYTRHMELELDKVEAEKHDWVSMLRDFYKLFKQELDQAHKVMVHAKAEMEPAPFTCETCGAPTVYRFGKNGRFLSCSRYPDCKYAAQIDREGNPQLVEMTDILCPICGSGMTRRTGRFGPFLGCVNYPKCKGIIKLDAKKGTVVLPKTAPLLQNDLPCPKCGSPLYLRTSKRGLWLSCSTYPKCRGRVAFNSLEEPKQKALEAAWQVHEKANPVAVIKTKDGRVVEDGYVPQVTGGAPSSGSNAEPMPAGQADPETDAA